MRDTDWTQDGDNSGDNPQVRLVLFVERRCSGLHGGYFGETNYLGTKWSWYSELYLPSYLKHIFSQEAHEIKIH